MISDTQLDQMERVYTSVIPGVMDSQELEDVRKLIAEVRHYRAMLTEQNKQVVLMNDKIARLSEALQFIACPKRPDGTYNRSREACEQLACDALKAK